MWQCGTAESVEKSNHTTPAPPQHLRSTTEWEQCKQPLLLLAQLRAPVVHRWRYAHATFHPCPLPHPHPHPLSQPPKRDMTHSSHNMAQLPFLYAVVEIHAQRYMHGWSKIATEALDLGSGTGSGAPGPRPKPPSPPDPFSTMLDPIRTLWGQTLFQSD